MERGKAYKISVFRGEENPMLLFIGFFFNHRLDCFAD